MLLNRSARSLNFKDMIKRVFTIIKEDLIFFPPTLSLIRALTDLNVQVVHLGYYSDKVQRMKLENKGVIFVDLIKYNNTDSLPHKLIKQYKFKSRVKSYLESSNITHDDYVWILNAETVCLLSNLVGKYRTILQFYEFQNPIFNWKYWLLNPTYKYVRTLHKAEKIVHCEYNRAQLSKGLYDLETLPFILPNKPYTDEEDIVNIPQDVECIVDSIKLKTEGKKVVLYQGIFKSKERRLWEFCQAIKEMPDDFVLIAMGRGNEDYERLKSEFESDKILFVPFLRPPYHLMVTELSSVCVLSYFPSSETFAHTVNPIYCAPNKIYEYAKYGKPMISNDIPGLYYPFKLYNCGCCIKYPMTVEHVKNTLNEIFDNYENLSKGALNFYNSVDIKNIVLDIISS